LLIANTLAIELPGRNQEIIERFFCRPIARVYRNFFGHLPGETSSLVKGRTTRGLFVPGFSFALAAASNHRSALPSIRRLSSREMRKQCMPVSAQDSMAIAPFGQSCEKISV
jgi:hypothetical protein